MTNTIPTSGSSLAAPDRSLSLQVSLPTLQRMYSLFLWDLNTGSIPSSQVMDPSGNHNTMEYFFTTPPQVLEDDNPFATTITYTQNGSKFTDSYGVLSKVFRITGTTGVRPNKISSLISGTAVVAQPAAQNADGNFQGTVTPATATEFTGHDSIVMLSNLFALYSDYMASGTPSIVMVWRNIKDDDYWIVEPLDYKKNQTSKSPFSYTYNILLKSLARFDKSLANISAQDPQDNIRGDSGFSSRMQKNSQTMVTSYYSTIMSGDILQGVTNVSQITQPLQTLVNLTTQAATGGIVQAERIVGTAISLKTQLVTSLNKIISLPTAVTKRVTRLKRDWRRLIITCDSILTEKRYQNAVRNYFVRRDRVTSTYTSTSPYAPGSRYMPNTGGSPTFLGNTPATPNVSQGVVQSNDDIRLIAQRYLGDPRRWQELVVINELRPPYVTPDGSGNTLKPGDSILFPSAVTKNAPTLVGVQTGSNQNYDDADFRDTTLLMDQTYGRDILLSSNEASGDFDLTDMKVNQRGDLATVAGIENVVQAINIKFSTEQGQLKIHPYFGARYAIGSKATTKSFNEFRANTLSTLLSDGRIEDVTSLVISSVADTLSVSAKLQLINGEDYINTSFSLRRF